MNNKDIDQLLNSQSASLNKLHNIVKETLKSEELKTNRVNLHQSLIASSPSYASIIEAIKSKLNLLKKIIKKKKNYFQNLFIFL